MARKQLNQYYLYCISEDGSPLGPCKVGVASYPDSRLCSLQGGNHRRISFAWVSAFKNRDNAIDVERHILGRIRTQRGRKPLCSEWLDASPDEIWGAGSELIGALLELESA